MRSDRDVAERAVRAGAARRPRRWPATRSTARRKGAPADLVSAADRAGEEAIVALLRAERPDDAITGEEGADVGGRQRRWLVDGLDGTVNFLRAIPQWCVAVALERDGEPLAAAVLDPVRDELFSAARGEGAARDGVALRVRAGAPLPEAVISSFLRADKLRGADAVAAFGPLVAGPRRAAHGRRGLARARVAGRRAPGRLGTAARAPWDWQPRAPARPGGGRARRGWWTASRSTWHVAAAPGHVRRALRPAAPIVAPQVSPARRAASRVVRRTLSRAPTPTARCTARRAGLDAARPRAGQAAGVRHRPAAR